jgi:hypothetical protein
MMTLRQFYQHMLFCMLFGNQKVNYSQRAVAAEMLAGLFGWSYKTDLDFIYTYMEKSRLFETPIEKEISPPMVVEVAPNKGRLLGTLPAGMGF